MLNPCIYVDNAIYGCGKCVSIKLSPILPMLNLWREIKAMMYFEGMSRCVSGVDMHVRKSRDGSVLGCLCMPGVLCSFLLYLRYLGKVRWISTTKGHGNGQVYFLLLRQLTTDGVYVATVRGNSPITEYEQKCLGSRSNSEILLFRLDIKSSAQKGEAIFKLNL